jgi:hypothetical protein
MLSEHEQNGDKAVMAYFKVFTLHLSGGTEERMKSLRKVGVIAEVCMDTSQLQVRIDTT